MRVTNLKYNKKNEMKILVGKIMNRYKNNAAQASYMYLKIG